jgi:glutamate racemase
MTSSHASTPIGIFDSGIGGLTVAHALVKLLPHEHIIYFGDTAHLPYGDKSAAAVQGYAVKIAQLLAEQPCKLILIACHTASAVALELVQAQIGTRATVMNVIDPVIELLKAQHAHQHIGLIGTRQTVQSHIYKKKLDALDLGMQVSAYATNLLAAAIEEFGDHPVIDTLLKTYLSAPELQDIDTLVLACTHYPIVKDKIAHYYHGRVAVIDSAETTAKAVKTLLKAQHLLNPGTTPPTRKFYLSDYTATFENHAKRFFGNQITLEHYPLWENT